MIGLVAECQRTSRMNGLERGITGVPGPNETVRIVKEIEFLYIYFLCSSSIWDKASEFPGAYWG